MTKSPQPPAEEDLITFSDKIFHSFVETSYAVMKDMTEKYGAKIAMSLTLMTAAQFVAHAHFAAGMDKETILSLLKDAVDDAENDQEPVAQH